jgi:two-component system alkaline phosphatase synthesis response regulator PhoP
MPQAAQRMRRRVVAEPSIIIVEDEPDIADLIRFHVEREGFQARIIHSGRIALEEIRKYRPHLVVLDLMLPDLDGREVCRRLKWDERTRATPIIIVSAKGDEPDIVAGLELGADDYVTKPFSPKVLMARVRNILRRHQSGAANDEADRKSLSMAGGAVVIDLDRHVVTVNGDAIDLTRTEFGILHCLASRPGFVRTRDQIITTVHGDDAVLTSRTVDVHVTAIRRKLGELGSMIKTVRGVGYRFDETAVEASAR